MSTNNNTNTGSQSSGGRSKGSSNMTSLRKRRMKQYANFQEDHDTSNSNSDDEPMPPLITLPTSTASVLAEQNGGNGSPVKDIHIPSGSVSGSNNGNGNFPFKRPKRDAIDILLAAHDMNMSSQSQSTGGTLTVSAVKESLTQDRDNENMNVNDTMKEFKGQVGTLKQDQTQGQPQDVITNANPLPQPLSLPQPQPQFQRHPSLPKDDKMLQTYQQTGALDEVFGSQSKLSQELNLDFAQPPYSSPEQKPKQQQPQHQAQQQQQPQAQPHTNVAVGDSVMSEKEKMNSSNISNPAKQQQQQQQHQQYENHPLLEQKNLPMTMPMRSLASPCMNKDASNNNANTNAPITSQAQGNDYITNLHSNVNANANAPSQESFSLGSLPELPLSQSLPPSMPLPLPFSSSQLSQISQMSQSMPFSSQLSQISMSDLQDASIGIGNGGGGPLLNVAALETDLENQKKDSDHTHVNMSPYATTSASATKHHIATNVDQGNFATKSPQVTAYAPRKELESISAKALPLPPLPPQLQSKQGDPLPLPLTGIHCNPSEGIYVTNHPHLHTESTVEIAKCANANSGLAPIEAMLGKDSFIPASKMLLPPLPTPTGTLLSSSFPSNPNGANPASPNFNSYSNATTSAAPGAGAGAGARAGAGETIEKLVTFPIPKEVAGPYNPYDPMLHEMAEIAAADRRIANANPGQGFATWVPVKNKKQKYAQEAEAKEIAKRAAELVAQMAVNRKVEKQLLLSMTLSRESPRSANIMPPPGNKLKPGFHWGHFPPLEKLLRSHMEEYYELSIKKCQSTLQQEFNNKLVKKTQYLAYWHGWAFEGFTDRELRDRIRCFFKTHIQNAKKRLKTMIKNPSKKANAKALVTHFDLIQKHNHTHQELEFAEDYMKDRGKSFEKKSGVDADVEDKDAARVLMQGFRKSVLSPSERDI